MLRASLLTAIVLAATAVAAPAAPAASAASAAPADPVDGPTTADRGATPDAAHGPPETAGDAPPPRQWEPGEKAPPGDAPRPMATRSDDTDKPVLVVHGRTNMDMGGFQGLVDFYAANGWEQVYRYGYYGGECNIEYDASHHGSHNGVAGGDGEHISEAVTCGTRLHDENTDITHLSYHYAWAVYDHFTSQDVVVDVVAHSMGGLLIREALAHQGDAGWPPSLLVEDITTMGTPHEGVDEWCWFSPTSDGRQMCEGSSYMDWLHQNAMDPQSNGWSTDWTVMGSDCDGVVDWDEAVTHIDAAHRVVAVDPCLGHSDYYQDTATTNDATMDYQDAPDTTWYRWSSAPHSVKWSHYSSIYGTW